MFDIFRPLIDLFSFIGTIFNYIYEGIYGTIQILTGVINLIINITMILPNPLYSCLLAFLSLYLIIFTYKIFRQG